MHEWGHSRNTCDQSSLIHIQKESPSILISYLNGYLLILLTKIYIVINSYFI
jgi:hypothetical protein